MIKTINVKKEMNFRELMEYILENDIRGKVFRCRQDKHKFSVCQDGIFDFLYLRYDMGEIYEIELEEEITEDTKFRVLIEIFSKTHTITHNFKSVKEIKDDGTEKIYALVDGELQLVWQRGEE